MWFPVIVTALAVVAASVAEEQQTTFAGLRGVVEPRLAASGFRIARLEYELDQLDHAIDEAKKIDPMGFVLEMHNRLNNVEKGRCSRTHVQCGWQSTECVSNLLLCDGRNDCHNGWDEDEHTCSHGAIRAGNVFTGMLRWQNCLPLREHPISLKITGVVNLKAFGARLMVFAHISGDHPTLHIHREADMRGYYVFGVKGLALGPVAEAGVGSHIGLVCHFNRGDDERADCQLVNEASMEVCAVAHLTLEHHDLHHTQHHHGPHAHHEDREDVEDHRGEEVKHHYDEMGHDHSEQQDKRRH